MEKLVKQKNWLNMEKLVKWKNQLNTKNWLNRKIS